MTGEYAEKRRHAIETTAFEVLVEKGYKAASMLEVARRANASNETLYKWYGNKQGLFRALVEANAETVRTYLQDAVAPDGDASDPMEAIVRLGPALLGLVTGDRAVALNRAAVGDVHDTGTLGTIISASGRETVLPLIEALFERARSEGHLAYDDTDRIGEIWISLLIGDLQIRRAIGAIAVLSEQEAEARSRRATDLVARLFAAGKSATGV